MAVWFVTYNDFYLKKICSQELCSTLDDSSILEDKNCSQLVQCFLDTNNMVKLRSSSHDDRSESTTFSPIYQLFNPSNVHQDQSESDMKLALANLIGVILGTPKSNHLWYHLLEPEKLNGTFMTGFMYNKPVGSGRYTYDSGTELNLFTGDFARREFKAHAYRGSFTHHSLYCLLWANFGTFCISLLTQKKAEKKLKGCIISDKLNVHDYCFEQLQLLWKLLRDNLKLSDERRSHFVKLLIEQLYQEQQSFQNGIFNSSQDLLDYEKKWHTLVYKPAWDEAFDKYIDFSNEKEHQIYQDIRNMEELFPIIPSEEDLIYSILSQGSLDQISEGGQYHCVLRFAMELKQLQIGGELLPDLIEFYKWIHSDLSLRITRHRATKITISDVLQIAIKHSSDDAGDHLKKLYERIMRNCMQYQTAETSSTTGAINLKRKKKIMFNNRTPLLHFLSDTENEGQGKDYLYQLITEILTDHNSTINRFFIAAKKRNLLLLPDTLLEVHPTEVTSDCVIISSAKDIDIFHALLRSRYIPSYTSLKCKKVGSHVRRDISYFELDRLEEDIISHFIRGKPLMKSTVTLRTVFKFRKENLNKDSADLNVIQSTLDSMKQHLPASYKSPFSSDTLSHVIYCFHSSSYALLNETVTFLIIVINLLMKKLEEEDDHDSSEELTISQFMLNVYEEANFRTIMQKLKYYPGSDIQRKLMESMKLEFIFSFFEFFYYWLEKGFYNFSSVPRYFKQSMKMDDRDKIEVKIFLHVKREGKLLDMTKELQKLIGALKIKHNELVKEVKDEAKPILNILLEKNIVEQESLLVTMLPKSIKLHHYVDFRISIRKLLDRIQQETVECTKVDRWPELVDDLWSEHLPHIREIIFHTNMEFVEKQSIEIYGFPVQEEDIPFEDEFRKDLETEPAKSPNSDIKESRNAKDIAHRTSVQDVCNFLKEIKLPEYINQFTENEIDGSILFELDPENLEDVGVSNPLHQVLITQLFDRKIKGTPPKYTIRHVSDFLIKKNLDKYITSLEKARIDGDMILNVNQKLMIKALQEIGLSAIVAKKICLKFEEQLT